MHYQNVRKRLTKSFIGKVNLMKTKMKGRVGVSLLCLVTMGWSAAWAAGTNDTYCQVAGSSCLSFDGTDDYVNLGNNTSLRLTGNMTIAVWVKLESGNTGQYMGIAGKLATTSGTNYKGYCLVRYTNDRLRFLTADGIVDSVDSTESYADTDWHHVVGMLDNGVMKIYVDGVFQAQSTPGNIIVDSGQYAFIGRQYSDWTGRYLRGMADDLRIYNKALTSVQVTTAMTSVPTLPQSGLVGYWNMDEGTGQTVNDLSGYGNQGYLGGAVTADGADPQWVDTSAFCVTERTYYVDTTSGNDAYSGLTPVNAFKTIQRGINAAVNGDTVVVLPGEYRGTGNKELDFGGRAITVRSQNGPEATVINCQGSGRAFYFHTAEGASSIVEGLTLTGGNSATGAAIYCLGAGPTISGCVIRGNSTSSTSSGIVYCNNNGNAVITGCTIQGNSGNSSALRFNSSSGQVIECLVYDNSCTGSGGAIRCENGSKTTIIRNCTVVGNTSGSSGGGLWVKSATAQVVNSIFWGNTATAGGSQLSHSSPATLTVNYSDVSGGPLGVTGSGTLVWGIGNLNQDPNFVDAAVKDYHLRSTRGRYWPEHQVWVLDTVSSVCIDAGDPSSAYDLEPEPNGGRINMGAYGGTVYASLSPEGGSGGLVGDVNQDGVIDFDDLFALIDQWLALYEDQIAL